MKTSARENEHNKKENRQPQIENPVYTENTIKIDKMKQKIIRELAKISNIDLFITLSRTYIELIMYALLKAFLKLWTYKRIRMLIFESEHL